MFCEECGKKLPEGARFCENCGAPVKQPGAGEYEQDEPYGDDRSGYREEPYHEIQPDDRQEPYIDESFRNPYGAPDNQPPRKQKKGNGSTVVIVILSITAAVLLIALIVLGVRYFGGQKSDPVKQPREAVEETETEEPAEEASETEETETETEKAENRYAISSSGAEESSRETAESAAVQDYILPASNTAYLTEADLAGLTKEELRLARNELYARHGRKFKDESLNRYFSAKSWYHPTIEPDQFDESVFNEYEIANRKLIADYEKKMGY